MEKLDQLVNQTGHDSLAELLSLSAQEGEDWSAEDLRAMLQHQLDQELVSDFSSLSPAAGETVTVMLTEVNEPPRTYRELLQHGSPPLRVLELGKDMAKASRSDEDSPLPADIATYIYYACIAGALVRRVHRITSLGDRDLRRGLQWAVDVEWGDDGIRSLLKDTMERLGAL